MSYFDKIKQLNSSTHESLNNSIKSLNNLTSVDTSKKSSQRKIKYIAHRGNSAKYVDNSIQAFHSAMDYKIDMIETDIRLNKDNQWMIFHDSILINTSLQSVRFEELTTKQCNELDIISLETFFIYFVAHQRYKSIELYLDIKGNPLKSDLYKLTDIIHNISIDFKYDINNFYLASFNFYAVKLLTDIKSALHINGVFDDFNIGFIGQLVPQLYKDTYVDFVATDDDLVDAAYIQSIKKIAGDIQLFVYVINDKRLIEYYRNLGVDGVLSDDPTLFFD